MVTEENFSLKWLELVQNIFFFQANLPYFLRDFEILRLLQNPSKPKSPLLFSEIFDQGKSIKLWLRMTGTSTKLNYLG